MTYDFVSFTAVVDEHPRLSTVHEFLAEWGGLKEEGRLGEIGGRRLEDAIDQFVSHPAIRLVVGLFRLNDYISLLTVCRVHSPTDVEDPDQVTAFGGFSALVRDLEEDSDGLTMDW